MMQRWIFLKIKSIFFSLEFEFKGIFFLGHMYFPYIKFHKNIQKLINGNCFQLDESSNFSFLEKWKVVTCKISTKVLQWRLKEIITKVINFDQVVLFVIMIYSKQSLIHETLAWGKKFKWNLIFLKPNFHGIW
jgi:hypothetical protein